MQNSNVIIFDMDGVIFDSTHCIGEEIQRLYPGLTKEMVKELTCGNWHEEVMKLTIPRIVETEEEAKRTRALYAKKKSEALPYTGMLEVLNNLQNNNCKLVLNTSASEDACIPLLEKHKLVSMFDFLGTKEVSKSKTEKFDLIAQRYNVQKQNLIFVTDTLGDIREADEAGVPTIAVTWGAHDASYFNRESHENLIGIVDSVSALEKLLIKQ